MTRIEYQAGHVIVLSDYDTVKRAVDNAITNRIRFIQFTSTKETPDKPFTLAVESIISYTRFGRGF